MIKEIEIKPEVLSVLIKTSGYEKEEVLQIMRISRDRLERGKLTLSQLKRLAEILKRPLSAFFSAEVPELKVPPDYRLNREKKINPEVFLAQRKLEYLIEKLKELGCEDSSIPSFPLTLKPYRLAKKFREYLGVELIKNENPDKLLERYKEILEDKINIVIVEYPLKSRKTKKLEISDDVRAFSLYRDISGIVLNESDHSSVKLFSLFHEVCHLLRRTSGICSIEYEVETEFREESYCNKFAAEFLVPSEDIKKELKNVFIDKNTLPEILSNFSRIYAVSKQVILLRLLYLDQISAEEYKEFKKYLEEKGGKPQYAIRRWNKVFKNRVGNVVIKKVKASLRGNKISFYEALNILDMKIKYAEKLLYE